LTVQLAIGGTATAGLDYQSVATPAIIPARASTLDIPFVPVTDNVAEGNETIVVTALDGLSSYRSRNQFVHATIAIADLPTDAWRFQNFGVNANNPAIAGNDVDPDGDTKSNLHE